MTAAAIAMPTGMVTSAISASVPRDREHHPDHEHDREQRGEHLAHRLLKALGDVVHVVGDPAEQLTAWLAVEVAQRQPVELVLDLGAHPQHRVLDDVVEEVALEEPEQGRADVEGEHDQQHGAQCGEVDALARDEIDAGQEVGDPALAGRLRGGDGLRLGHAGRKRSCRSLRRR